MNTLRGLALYAVLCLALHVDLLRSLLILAIAGWSALILFGLSVVLRRAWERREAVRTRAVLRATRKVVDDYEWVISEENRRARARHPSAR